MHSNFELKESGPSHNRGLPYGTSCKNYLPEYQVFATKLNKTNQSLLVSNITSSSFYLKRINQLNDVIRANGPKMCCMGSLGVLQ